MEAAFNPDRLTPIASLNRVRIVDLPGIDLESSVRGKLAYDLLSAQAITHLLQEQAEPLGLAGEPADLVRLPIQFDRRFESGDEEIRACAEKIAQRFGQRLGYLIATLKRGDEANRLARTEWTGVHWDHWKRIQHIWLGGGIVSGGLGQRVLPHVRAVLAEVGVADCAVSLSTHPRMLPLIGAARSAPPNVQAALVFDFGHSSVKRAVASYESGMLTALHILPAIPVCSAAHGLDAQDESRLFAQTMADVMAETWREANKPDLVPVFVSSIAAYVIDGQPAEYDRGAYANLRAVVGHLGDWLSCSVGERLSRDVRIQLIHDGTAAARVFAGQPRTAAILLGTALGVGFPPDGAGLRPVSSPLECRAQLTKRAGVARMLPYRKYL